MADQIDTMIARIAERLEAVGLKERAASIQATGSPDAIRYIRSRRCKPSAQRLNQIAGVLQCSVGYLLGADEIEEPNPQVGNEPIPDDVVSALGRVARQLMELVMEQREEIKELKAQNSDLAALLAPFPPSTPAEREGAR